MSPFFRRIWCNIAAVACLLVATAIASAQVGQWRATHADLSEVNGPLASLTIEANGFDTSLGEGQAILLEHMLPAGFARAAGPFTLYLVNGDALRGKLTALDDSAITLATIDFGEVRVPLENALALVANQAGSKQNWRLDRPAGDVVRLANGDRVEGFVSGFERSGALLTIEPNAGGALQIPLSTLRFLQFADTGLPAQVTTESVARLALTDGSIVSVSAITREGDQFAMTYGDSPTVLGADAIFAIEPANAPVVWLADLMPTAVAHTPYFSAASPPEFDSGLGSVVQARLTETGRGRSLHVRSRTSIGYDIPPGEWKTLRVGYRIDPTALPAEFADVDVRILLDGKVAHEQVGVTAETGERTVDVPLGNATSIELVVDFGKALDAQDAVLWTRPALLQ